MSSRNSSASTFEFNRNGHRYREIKYDYSNGKLRRIEFYISKDSVSETNPFPKNDIWLKDSIWTYYKNDGTIEKTEIHNNK